MQCLHGVCKDPCSVCDNSASCSIQNDTILCNSNPDNNTHAILKQKDPKVIFSNDNNETISINHDKSTESATIKTSTEFEPLISTKMSEKLTTMLTSADNFEETTSSSTIDASQNTSTTKEMFDNNESSTKTIFETSTKLDKTSTISVDKSTQKPNDKLSTFNHVELTTESSEKSSTIFNTDDFKTETDLITSTTSKYSETKINNKEPTSTVSSMKSSVTEKWTTEAYSKSPSKNDVIALTEPGDITTAVPYDKGSSTEELFDLSSEIPFTTEYSNMKGNTENVNTKSNSNVPSDSEKFITTDLPIIFDDTTHNDYDLKTTTKAPESSMKVEIKLSTKSSVKSSTAKTLITGSTDFVESQKYDDKEETTESFSKSPIEPILIITTSAIDQKSSFKENFPSTTEPLDATTTTTEPYSHEENSAQEKLTTIEYPNIKISPNYDTTIKSVITSTEKSDVNDNTQSLTITISADERTEEILTERNINTSTNFNDETTTQFPDSSKSTLKSTIDSLHVTDENVVTTESNDLTSTKSISEINNNSSSTDKNIQTSTEYGIETSKKIFETSTYDNELTESSFDTTTDSKIIATTQENTNEENVIITTGFDFLTSTQLSDRKGNKENFTKENMKTTTDSNEEKSTVESENLLTSKTENDKTTTLHMQNFTTSSFTESSTTKIVKTEIKKDDSLVKQDRKSDSNEEEFPTKTTSKIFEIKYKETTVDQLATFSTTPHDSEFLDLQYREEEHNSTKTKLKSTTPVNEIFEYNHDITTKDYLRESEVTTIIEESTTEYSEYDENSSDRENLLTTPLPESSCSSNENCDNNFECRQGVCVDPCSLYHFCILKTPCLYSQNNSSCSCSEADVIYAKKCKENKGNHLYDI